ncbi:aldehyde dehydrogenase family protein [Micromonospora sp. NPDC048830]|uniref:aldehyde dehydrogenase family protein n=1 Tax=Micromonospora sp. NPDC048830 TaxID=3364257 RepID=UPI00371E6A77
MIDPATGRLLTQVADAGPEDGRAALDAASAAQSDWATLPPRERSDILLRAYDQLLVTVQLVWGSQVCPLWRRVRASRALMPCLRAVDR